MTTLEVKTGISPEQIADFDHAFNADPQYRLALNAVTQNPVTGVALNRAVIHRTDHIYSHKLKSNEATSQDKSGRCWIFAALNLFRVEVMKSLNVETFELSQSYLMFWDKLEKAHYFLETIIQTLDEPTDGRLIMHLVQNPIQDGGQWDMFANLVRKYGVVPKSIMPETESSGNTRAMNAMITAKLREFAAELRRRKDEGVEALRERKMEMLDVVYRMLAIHLGQPPQDFYWQWRDKDDNFHRDGTLTPQAFFDKYVGYDLDSLVCLIHCPTADKPFNRMYTIQHLGNVYEGDIIRYLNVALDVFKQAAVDMLVDGRPVWFGCDVGKNLDREHGILDMEVYDLESVYGTGLYSDKAERIDYGQSMMTHAMVFNGVNLDEDNRPTKWRVENSWGDSLGDKGYLVMADNWFDEYMYEVLVDKRYVPAELLPVLESEPVVLPPWDPMGALASAE